MPLDYQTLHAKAELCLVHTDSVNFGDSGNNKKMDSEQNKVK